MKVTYYGHSCLGVELAKHHLLFDPFITGNDLAKRVEITQIPVDCLLLSHGHGDHIGDAVAIAKRTGALCVANYEICQWLNKNGISKTQPMNHGGSARFDFGTVKLVNAIHSSSLPDGSYGGNPAGFVVESPEGSFYFSGDTALTMDMRLIGESTRLAFAALCLGDNFTMGIDDAIKAAEFVRCNQVIGIHFDTFPPIKIDHAAATERFRAAGKTLHLLEPGSTCNL
jgi:L-ascorbate metabolism protein UlaG (beta-lactamase superfamily)